MSSIKITLIKSPNGRSPEQRATLVALGLTKTNAITVKKSNNAIAGMVRVVQHLVKVEDVQ